MEVIDLLSGDDAGDSEEESSKRVDQDTASITCGARVGGPSAKISNASKPSEGPASAESGDDVAIVDGEPPQRQTVAKELDPIFYVKNPYEKKRKAPPPKQRRQNPRKAQLKGPPDRELQAGLVFEEDVDQDQHHQSSEASASLKRPSSSLGGDSSGDEAEGSGAMKAPSSAREYAQHQQTNRIAHGLPPILYHDTEFVAGSPDTIDGSAKKGKFGSGSISIAPPKCRCRPAKPCSLAYSTKAGQNYDRPFYCCSKGKGNGCNFFSWAFTSNLMHWYRFGAHNGHVLVKPNRGFRAEDLVQGKVGDCWFLSALAVVAEREDLIGRLIGDNAKNASDNCGVLEVKLFVDGYWKKVIIDDFLPCLIDQQSEKEEEDQMQLALKMSMASAGINPQWNGAAASTKAANKRQTSSKFDPHSIADDCRKTLEETKEFLHHDRFSKDPAYRANHQNSFVSHCSQPLHRHAQTSDLAYSKARHSQLWVPFVEKAYAKIHGSYRAISGGHVEEAFLDLTGAPTAVYTFEHRNFNPRQFWSDLMSFRRKRLPMGCGTSSSQGGIIGMHAYSILDVREVKNVGIDFFRDKLARGTLGGVSGFTEMDGTVRLLRIRNPHGKGEWKGEFSDNSPIWERLMANKGTSWKESNGMVDLTTAPAPQSPEMKRTMVNDGTFWIDFDSFLMGFHNVDVVLAFAGNHAKSFGSSFPVKKSNHRCTRAFEVSAVGRQPGEEGPYTEEVDLFLMSIQKTQRGAKSGRVDRKKSYKASDVGILVAECSGVDKKGQVELGAVDGQFFGLTRNGHIRLKLNRRDPNRRIIVMPISFGHPSATDEERSFVVRFVADAPLLVQELAKLPDMKMALHKFCFGGKVMALGAAGTSSHIGSQGTSTVLMERRANNTLLYKVVRIDCLADGGGTVLLYLVVNEDASQHEPISFSIEVNCRGMLCRTASGMEAHEVVSKGKKFEAAWRRFTLGFEGETNSRLLATVVQGGVDHQMGSIKCSYGSLGQCAVGPLSKFISKKSTDEAFNGKPSNGKQRKRSRFANDEEFGVFASVEGVDPSILRIECVDLSQQMVQFPAHRYERTEPIVIDEGPMNSGKESDMDAAIAASLVESQRTSNKEAQSTAFSDDIEKAIALSLQDK